MSEVGYLLSDCARQMRRVFDERMRQIGVTGPQARLMMLLSRREGEQQGFYAGELDVEPITLCRMVDRMVDAGLVERRADPSDRRARLLYPTAKALNNMDELESAIDKLRTDVHSAFAPSELETLRQLLGQLSKNLAELQAPTDDNGKQATYG